MAAPSRPLLLLSPSAGLGGGIERVAAAVETGWPGPVLRIDLASPGAAGGAAGKLRFARSAAGAALRHRPAAVLALHVGLLPVALAAGALGRAPVTLMGMGIEVWRPMSAAQRRAVARCAGLLAISTFTADWMARRAGVDRSRIEVVPLPVGARFEAVARRDTGRERSPAGGHLLTVTRLASEHRYKGYFTVAEGLARVLERRPGTRWVVVGGGDDAEPLRARCTELGVADSVDVLGGVSEEQLEAAYADAAMLVLPSVADPEADPPAGEGFGLVYAEAAVYGTPSIGSTEGGGSLDFIRAEETGLAVPPGDPGALADAIVRLAGDDDLRGRLGAAARNLVRERHLPEHFGVRLREVLPVAG